MRVETRRLVAEPLPPLTLPRPLSRRSPRIDPLLRLRRIAYLLAALGLPAIGIVAADKVHGLCGTGTFRTAAIPPSGGATLAGAVARLRAAEAVVAKAISTDMRS
ncbi:MAG: protein of unassigned function [Methylobacterium brachiatum]|jgi:hypothetical protein|nr:protein of unassigned function [Methylobacterium brachiatum]